MRLIDADALIEEMSEKHRPNFHEDLKAYHMWLMWYWALKDAPTIDAVSVVHGEWIEHKQRTIVRDNNFIDFFPTEYECSNCGLRRATYSINSPLSNYCPNCGAKMKGAGDDEH